MDLVLLAVLAVPVWLVVRAVRRRHRHATTPATASQLDFIRDLMKERRGAHRVVDREELDSLNIRSAHLVIDELLELPEKDD